MVEKLRSIGMNSIRILFLGKTGTGKSSTINSFLGEKYASDVGALHGRATDEVITFTRVLEGFSFVIIDTPGLIEGNILSETAFRKIKDFLVQPGNTVDIVMFCERIDIYRIEPIDRRVIDAVSTLLGKDIWRHAMFVFTRAYVANPPDGLTFEEFVNRRIHMMRSTVATRIATNIPVALVENLRAKAGVDGQMLLPDGTAWFPCLVNKMLQLVESAGSPFSYDPKQENRSNPNHNHKLLIPLVFALQCALKALIVDRLSNHEVIEEV
jgi:hypothetical protein